MALERKLLKRTSVDQSTARDFTVCKVKFEFNPSTNMNSYSHTYLHVLHVMHNQVKAFLKQHLNQFEFFKSFCNNGEKIHVPYGCHHNPQHVYYSIQGGFFIKSCTFVWLVFKTAFLNKNGICIYAICIYPHTILYHILVIIKLKRVNFLFDNVITFNCTQTLML